MDRLFGIVGLINAASGAGETTVDAAALRDLLTALSVESALVVVSIVAAIVIITRISGRRRAIRENHETAGFRGNQEDTTGRDKIRKQLDEMILKTNERNNYINSIFSSIEDGFMLVDAKNDIALYNPKAQFLLGIGPGVFFGSPCKDGAYTGAVSAILDACGSVTRTRIARQLQLDSSSGAILDVRVVPVTNKYRNAENLGSLAIVKDVTEIRKMENLKKDFVATVSHEFRTPLTLISGFMEMFRMQKDIDPADRKRAFEIVGIETERLKRLVSELLTLSEIENSIPRNAAERIGVKEAIETIAASLGTLARKKGQNFSVHVDPGAGTLRGNGDWFHQAVRNLVENAIKYTQKGGSIALDAGRDGGELVIAVSDTGIGIAQDELDRIFERFYRVEKSRGSGSGGSGLGLALVKDIATIFGGSVTVSSEVGKGSIFTLRFPADAPD